MTSINFLLAFININTILRILWIQLVASPAYWTTPETAWIIHTPLTLTAVVGSKRALIFIYKSSEISFHKPRKMRERDREIKHKRIFSYTIHAIALELCTSLQSIARNSEYDKNYAGFFIL